MITIEIKLDGNSWVKMSDFITVDSSISEVTGNKVIVVASTSLPDAKLKQGHPIKKDQYLMTGAMLDSLYVRSVSVGALLIITPGLDLGY